MLRFSLFTLHSRFSRYFVQWISLLLIVCSGILGFLSFGAVRENMVSQKKERVESRELRAKTLARTLQGSVSRTFSNLGFDTSTVLPTRRLEQLQASIQHEPWIWHMVFLNKQGDLLWPNMQWEGKDDFQAYHAIEKFSCQDFRRKATKLQVGHAMRLAIATRLAKKKPSCELFDWIRVPLLIDTLMKHRSSRAWLFRTPRSGGVWSMRSQEYFFLVRPHTKGWVGFALRLGFDFSRIISPEWKKNVRSIWLTAEPSPKRLGGKTILGLTGVLSGLSLVIEEKETPLPYPWSIAVLIGLCVFLTVMASFLVTSALKKQRQLRLDREHFFTLVTHELKTPIAAQRALLDTLVHRELTNSQKREYQGNILQENARLQQLVENLLAYARVEQVVWMPNDFDLSAMCRQLSEDFEDGAFLKELTWECAITESYWVRAEKTTCSLAIRNVMDNALKYTEEGGRVVIELAVESEDIILRVCNSSPRISGELEQRVFQAFERGDSRKVKGSGLGLFLARQIFKKNHGDIELQSWQSEGNVFVMRLPKGNPERT